MPPKNNFIHFLQQIAEKQRSFMNHYADWMGFVTHAITISTEFIVMAALCNKAGHYIFALLFLTFFAFLRLSSFASHNLSGRKLDVYHTSTHGVALVRI